MFGCFNRKFKINEPEPPPDVRAAFIRYAEGAANMTADQLLKFLVEYQREEGCTPADVAAIMQQVCKNRHHSSTRRGLTLEDFFYFLFQEDFNGPINLQVHHDMSAPLQHYYIYTGHNSYLTGNQLNSACSELPIIKSLENGVRGIELDLWPNSAKDNVNVLHGRTLTTPVPLMKCLNSIKQHAFVKSPYPVIITLEDHLTPDLQAKVAEMVTQIFGEMLYCPESEYLEEFPSPEALKHKIILSTKPPKEYLIGSNININNKDGETSTSPMEKDSSDEEQSLREPFDKSDSDEDNSDKIKQKSGNLGAPEYKRLIAIHAGNAKKGLRHALRTNIDHKANRLSLSEQGLEKAASLYTADVVKFTQKNILRIFPKGTRVTSSNYNPQTGWMHGAQMVAFNMQGYGKCLWMMQGMYRSNGGCGYVKKPDLLMTRSPNNEVFDPKSPKPIKKTLKVTVYMGDGWRLDFSHTHFDAYSPPDFYTKVYIIGMPEDEAKKRTRIIEDDWVPYWDEEFTFPLRVPELALLRIENSMWKQSYRVCFCFRRRFRLTAAEAPADVKSIFEKYSQNGVMNADHLRRFLVEVQGEENASVEEAQGLVDGFHELKHLHLFYRRGISLETFFKYLLGDVNAPLDPKIGIHHDMTDPLSHYFIYTSHNTYLTGNQLSSDSSDIPIIRALQGGVRVIELDLWPNSAKNNVDVLHGRTFTTPVELIKCLKSIKEYAFTASEYPVVITLEDHLPANLQALVAKMITQTFGDMLFSPGSEVLTEFPSPESLKRRIIISTKPPKEYLEANKVKVKEVKSEKGQSSSEDEAWKKEIRDFKQNNDYDKADDVDGESAENDEEDEDDLKIQQQTTPEYKNLIAIPAGKGKGRLQDWLRVDPSSVRRLSLSELVLEKAIAQYGTDIVSFTQQNLLRVYPKAMRVASSNYNPLSAWMHGAQMVALNMQGYDKSLWFMHGMFRANGGCGYVKKPDFLLNSGSNREAFNPKAILPVKTTLKVGIAGVPADTMKKKTKQIEDNWIPTWDELFEFPLTVPELALLRIEVREYDASVKGKLAGQTCLPVWELRKGIRAVPLYSRKGEKYKCVKLLMRFEFV
ncbi:hypothetical protein RD792_013787 [Penstemon davidsonii]|uniref:Phosphoinositide phospholipase C n=1 Tax=Penstemon davidsonii TaxID=160366 RepID=A0ABR0CUG7_9LAMI|nr:hypothetical protein RD792_013787 [Penstemon davidsonii]